MSVTEQDPFNEHTANGVTTAFAYEFRIIAESHLVVEVDGETIPTSDYTISGVGDANGGTVTFDTAPADGATVLLLREVPLSRSVSYSANGPFPASTVNIDFDLLWMILQAMQARANGVLRVPYPDIIDDLPARSDLATKLLAFDADGQPEATNVTKTQIESAVAAAYSGASGPLDALSFIQAGVGAVSRTAQSKLREIVSVTDFYANGVSGAAVVGDGVTDCSGGFAAALATGATVLVPPGTYLINSKITLPNLARIIGCGREVTTIKSGVIGDSLFYTTASSVAFVHMADMTLEGNGLTGASGNGHALNFTDPTIDGGSHSPQFAVIERLYIKDFKGNDKVPGHATNTIEACGIVQADGLHNNYRGVLVQNCGHGFYLHRAQDTMLDHCAADGCMKASLIVYDSENVIAEKCAFVDCADGVASTNYPASFGSAIVISYQNENFVLSKCKLKNTNGGMLIRSILSDGDVIEKCWLRADSLTDNVHKGIYAERSMGIRILNNIFSPSNSGFTTRKYQQIELYNTVTTEALSATIAGNTFGNVPGMTIEYNIKLGGNAAARRLTGVVVRNNQFGWRDQASSACTVEADVLIYQCTLLDSEIVFNSHLASTNVTRTVGVIVDVSAVAPSGCTIGPNGFQANGGTITAEYTGITESVLSGSATFDPSSLADGAGETTIVTVTGAALGDFVSVSFSRDLQGITLTGSVSAANTVSARFQNETGGAIDLASGTLRARVMKNA